MPKTRQQKEEAVKQLTQQLSEAKSLVLMSFSGLPVSDVNELRSKCREQGVEYLVAKRTLLKRALEESGVTLDMDKMGGSVALAFAFEDEVSGPKIVNEFSKVHEALKVVGGALEGKEITVEAVINLAQLPSKEELIAKVVGTIAAPLSGFVNVLQGNLRNLVYVLSAIQEKK